MIGVQALRIDARNKLAYHAASVFSCNYLTALFDIALDLMRVAGIERDTAREMLIPLVQGTVSNLDKLDTPEALTGPIARADGKLVGQQLEAMRTLNPHYALLYRELGKIALELTRKTRRHSPEQCDKVASELAD